MIKHASYHAVDYETSLTQQELNAAFSLSNDFKLIVDSNDKRFAGRTIVVIIEGRLGLVKFGPI